MKRNRRHEAGAALVVSMLLMALLGVLALSALQIVMRDQQVAGYGRQRILAVNAAEAGAAIALQTLEDNDIPSVAAASLGDTGLFPHGQPSFMLDPTVALPVEQLGAGPLPNTNIVLGQGGLPKFQVKYWRVHIQGIGPTGAVARIELGAGKLSGS